MVLHGHPDSFPTSQKNTNMKNFLIYFSDWRNVDGFRLPCTLTQMIGNLTLVITIDEIRHNVAIDEAIFQRPGT